MSSDARVPKPAAGARHNPLLTASVLAVYVLLLILVLPRHEPFGDEQHVWVLALHDSLAHLFGTVLRQSEGTPGLWQFMLSMLARLHWSFLAARWLMTVFPVAGVYVWMRFSTYPLWLRAMVPFTFFVAYQYAIVARQYVLFPLLVFALAALACSPRWRPWTFAVCAGLLANVSFHGFCFALTFTGTMYLLRDRLPFSSRAVIRRFGLKQNRGPAMLLATLVLIAIATALPLPRHLPASAPIKTARVDYAIPLELPSDTPWLHVPPRRMNGLESALWRATMLRDTVINPPAKPLSKALHAAIIGLSVLAFPIAKSNFLALALLVLIWRRLARQRTRILLLPYLSIWLIVLFLHGYEHHTGLLLVALLAALWVSFAIDPLPAYANSPLRLLQAIFTQRQYESLEASLTLVLAVVLVLQVVWTAHALRADYLEPYTGDEQAVRFIARLDPHKTLARGPIGLVDNPPVFTHDLETPGITAATPPYAGDEESTMRALLARLAMRPDYVLEGSEDVGTDSLKNQITPMAAVGGPDFMVAAQRILAASGYHPTHRFCGHNFMRDGYSRTLCQTLYEPDGPSAVTIPAR